MGLESTSREDKGTKHKGHQQNDLCRSSSSRCSVLPIPPVSVSAVGLVEDPVEGESEAEGRSIAIVTVVVVSGAIVIVPIVAITLLFVARCGG
ncbi:hypothetical protein BDV98DRAFT_574468 [Pterulicium gracile]|uniref:Uncharacterized protein n=1 Tax=Pterulicium gracile TaxID=1884261 RepID=A0A5C3Q5S1_9AGAR|nr:hypothetical protein BDV98DRAFT_574468 [Pterula gracilis]